VTWTQDNNGDGDSRGSLPGKAPWRPSATAFKGSPTLPKCSSRLAEPSLALDTDSSGCWSALLLSMILVPSAAVTIVIGLALGWISLWISTKHWVGVTCFIFHGVAVWSCFQIFQSCGRLQTLCIAGGSWTIAWMFQVGVGHWIWEQNQPKIANNNKEVSYLAMCQSVLIAWSS
jgi:hypothetical protein